MSNDLFFNLIGFAGDVITLFAYFLLQTKKVRSDQLSYAIYNCIGSIFLLASLLHKTNAPAMLIEIAWLSLSIYGVVRYFYSSKSGKNHAKTNY